MNHPLRVKPLLFAAAAFLAAPTMTVAAGKPVCTTTAMASNGAAFPHALLDEADMIAGDVRHLELISRISDITGDGIREVLSFEDFNKLVIRNGATLGQISSGDFPYLLPAGSIPTQMGLIGDLAVGANGAEAKDGIQEIGVSLRYTGSANGQSAFVFDGATRRVIETYPATIAGLPQAPTPNNRGPFYPNPPPRSLMGVSVQVFGNQLIYADPQVNGGTVVFKTMCTEYLPEPRQYPCYDIRVLSAEDVTPHNLGVKMVGYDTPGGGRQIFLSDPTSDSLPVTGEGISDRLKVAAGSIVKYTGGLSVVRRGDTANGRLGFDLAIPTNSLLNLTTVVASSPTDETSNVDTGEFRIIETGGNVIRKFSPQLTEQNVQLGYALDAGDDLTGDNKPDVIVGAPGEGNEGRLRVYTPGTDYSNRMILQAPGSPIRFGHSVAMVGAGRVVAADGSGRIYAFKLSGADVGGVKATKCTNASLLTTTQTNELKALKSLASTVSTQIGSLKYQSPKARETVERLKAIKQRTDKIQNALASPTLEALEPKFNTAFRRDFAKRAKALQDKFKSGTKKQRKDAKTSLTSKANQIVRMSAAAMSK